MDTASVIRVLSISYYYCHFLSVEREVSANKVSESDVSLDYCWWKIKFTWLASFIHGCCRSRREHSEHTADSCRSPFCLRITREFDQWLKIYVKHDKPAAWLINQIIQTWRVLQWVVSPRRKIWWRLTRNLFPVRTMLSHVIAEAMLWEEIALFIVYLRKKKEVRRGIRISNRGTVWW